MGSLANRENDTCAWTPNFSFQASLAGRLAGQAGRQARSPAGGNPGGNSAAGLTKTGGLWQFPPQRNRPQSKICGRWHFQPNVNNPEKREYSQKRNIFGGSRKFWKNVDNPENVNRKSGTFVKLGGHRQLAAPGRPQSRPALRFS